MRRLFFIAFVLFLASFSRAQTFNNVSGHMQGADASACQTNVCTVHVKLRNFSGYVPKSCVTCTPLGAIIPDFDLDVDTLGQFASPIWANDNIVPENTFYTFTFIVNGKPVYSGNWTITGDISLDTTPQTNPPPPPPAPFLAVLLNPIAPQTMTGNQPLTNAGGFVGPLTGNVTGNASGNSGTATKLASTPNVCPPGQLAGGVDVFGNAINCAVGGGGGGSGNVTATSFTTNRIPKATGALSLADSLFTDDATTGAYTGSGYFQGTLFSKCHAGAGSTDICFKSEDDAAANLLKLQKNLTATFGSGAGGIFTTGAFVQGLCTVTFSATPSFDMGACNTFKLTLAGDVTSSTLANVPASGLSGRISFILCQDLTGLWEFKWPANVYGGTNVAKLNPSQCVEQTFVTDGSIATPVGPPTTFTASTGTDTRTSDDWASGGINVKRFGAKGDTTQVGDASGTSGSGAVSFAAPHGFSAADVGKVAIINLTPVARPTLGKICYATNASNGTCNDVGMPVNLNGTCTGGTAGTIDSTANRRPVYVVFSETNANGDGTDRSFEQWINLPIGLTAACVKVAAPTALNSATSWKVYASIEDGDPWAAATAFALNKIILDSNGNLQKVTTAGGNSGGTVPTWNATRGGTTVDNLVTWTNMGARILGTASGLESFQSSAANCNSGNPAIANPCELDAITVGGGSQPAPSFLVTTIATVVDTTHITLTANLTKTVANVSFTWATDDRPAITAALAALSTSVGGELVFPPGSYYISAPGLTAAASHFISLRGLGHSSSKNLNSNTPTSTGAAELVTGEPTIIWNYGTNGSTINSGFKWEGLGCRDVTQGMAFGCARMYGTGRSIFSNVGIQDFALGYGLKFDSGGTSNQSQFNRIDNVNMVAVHDGIIFTGGKSSENIITHPILVSSQFGGGTGIRWDANGGATSAGGGERVVQGQLLYFPRAIYVADRSTMEFDGIRGENSSAKQTSISGGNDINGGIFGTGLVIDGSLGFGFCTSISVLGGSWNLTGMAEVFQYPCTKIFTSGTSASTSDVGLIDRSTLSVALSAARGLTVTDANNVLVAQVANIDGSAFFSSVKSTSGQFIAPTNVDAVFGAVDSSTGAIAGGASLRGANWTATGAVTNDPVQMLCGNSQSTDTASKACDIIIQAGGSSAWTATGPQNGNFFVGKFYGSPTTNTIGNILCGFASDFKFANCATSAVSPIGVNISSVGTITKGQFIGEATVNYDATVSPAAGWFACTSAITAGKVLAQAGACGAGRQVGLIIAGGTNVTTGLIWLQFK